MEKRAQAITTGLPVPMRAVNIRSGLVLFALMFFPTALPYLLDLPSFAPGALLASLVILAFTPWRVKRKRFLVDSTEFLLAAVLLMIAIHAAIASEMVPVEWNRLVGSCAIFVGVFLGARAAGFSLFRSRNIFETLSRTFVCILICALLALAGLRVPGAKEFTKPVFPFTEPSHFALVFLPLLMWKCVDAKGWKRIGCLTFGFAIAFLFQNLTLLVGTLIISAVCIRVTRLLVLVPLVGCMMVAISPDVSYYSERLDISSATQNLSALVYLQGWQLIDEALINTNGWGIGFQQLGIHGTLAEASEQINNLMGEDLNLRDGGFLLAKLIAELGVVGILLLGVYLKAALSSFRWLRSAAMGRERVFTGTLYAHAIVFMFIIEIFVRSAGYFTGTGLLLIAALTHLYTSRCSRQLGWKT